MDSQLEALIKSALGNPSFFSISSGYINEKIITERLEAIKDFFEKNKEN